MAVTVEVVQPRDAEERPAAEIPPIIVDLGRKRRKLVKQLRKGRGKLMDDISRVIQEMKDGGAITSSAQPVVVVIREKPKSAGSLLGLLG